MLDGRSLAGNGRRVGCNKSRRQRDLGEEAISDTVAHELSVPATAAI
jgi:hypothetical protein